MKNFIGFFDNKCSSSAESDVVFVFAGNGAEDFVGPAGDWGFTHATASFLGGHGAWILVKEWFHLSFNR